MPPVGKPFFESKPTSAVATSRLTLPSMTSVADAGPLAASSDGCAPGISGKVLGSVSQMRPQSVSVWPPA